MKLRPYQEHAVHAVYDHLQTRDDNPCIVLPTGSGKSLVIAKICRDAVVQWGGRVLILAHVKELLQQNADKLHRLASDVNFGIYSAGLNSRDTKENVIVAGIQSVYNKACELGRFDLILIDEAHLLPKGTLTENRKKYCGISKSAKGNVPSECFINNFIEWKKENERTSLIICLPQK